jgi:flavodoxin
MKTYLLLFYSKTGNSKFIADKLSHELVCDSKEITPMFNNVLFLYLLSSLRIKIPTNISNEDIQKYDEIIIIGPIWGGLLISPLRTVINKSMKASKNIHFAVTCESTEEGKDNKYGYNQVLNSTKDLGGQLVKTTAAFSTSLIKGYDTKIKNRYYLKTKITEENFSNVLKLRLEEFVKKIKTT